VDLAGVLWHVALAPLAVLLAASRRILVAVRR
jgi:hypothetical protein